MTPQKAIKLKCKDCQLEKRNDQFCNGCFFLLKLTNLKKIKKYCKEFCMNKNSLDLCSNPECSLYLFRFGKNPNIKGNPDIKEKGFKTTQKQHDSNALF